MKRFHLSGDKDGNSEFHFYSNDRAILMEKGKEYAKQGYFVFLEDAIKGKLVEIRG